MRTISFFMVLFVTILICSLILILPANAGSDQSASRSWLDVEVLSFDGKSITARLTLKVQGNHVNGTLRVWGEFFSSQDHPSNHGEDGEGFTFTITTTVSVAVGRFVSDVTYSSDLNITTFQYCARFVSTYRPTSMILDFPNFPFDQHILKPIYLTTNFNASIDEHERIPTLPSRNYEGVYRVRRQPMEGSEYKYELTLDVRHSQSFFWLTLLFTWGIFTLLLWLTITLSIFVFRSSDRERCLKAATIPSAVILFIPMYEFASQSLKSPLPIVFSDLCFFILMGWNVILLIFILLRR